MTDPVQIHVDVALHPTRETDNPQARWICSPLGSYKAVYALGDTPARALAALEPILLELLTKPLKGAERKPVGRALTRPIRLHLHLTKIAWRPKFHDLLDGGGGGVSPVEQGAAPE